MLDLGGIALHAEDRGPDDTLVIAGGPGAQNPELLAPFVDLFVIGDGEPSLPVVCDLWKAMKGSGLSRARSWRGSPASVDWAYVPRFYEPIYRDDGTILEIRRTRDDVPEAIKPCVIRDLEAIPLPTRPIVPFVETTHDRIAIEIMRGCPWQCRFCQSTVIKRPLRYRTVETIVQAALESYQATGYDEISLLSLSTSDYPDFEELVTRMSEVFTPLGVKISLPSLRITETLKKIPALLAEGRRSGLTLAPEVARDDMREQIRKPINNQDLYDGCAEAFRRGWRKVKLYFMCGLPGERTADLDGIVEMAETIARIGKEVTGRYAEVTASVSNFIPKPHTPYQWNGMQTREYFHWAHRYLRSRVKLRSVTVKVHDIERSLLEGILTRGDRRVAPALEDAWRRGARLDAWSEHFDPRLWWDTFADLGIDVPFYSHRERPVEEVLPWDHIHIKYGREYLAKEQNRSRRAARSDGRSGVTEPDIRTQTHVHRFGSIVMATVAQTKLLTAEEFMAADLGEGTSSWCEGRLSKCRRQRRSTDAVCERNVEYVLGLWPQVGTRIRGIQRLGRVDRARSRYGPRPRRMLLQPRSLAPIPGWQRPAPRAARPRRRGLFAG